VALAFVDVGVGFADRAAVVVAVGFLRIYGFLHISICITPETMSTYDLWVVKLFIVIVCLLF
jgi:hypothetical protein